ncbi:hypothetical protein C4D60_Mb01t32110 [Musa balbisiana]|uniref:Uncharacterized protein n=1 Tax=Musa balbisiana TaxID=52838 RepID=A0A4V4H7T7_MUSBA|nr:hypothetical protein C4D60_Mb01t32110 [Musa balbisiana]
MLAHGQVASRVGSYGCNPVGKIAHGDAQPQGRRHPQAGAAPPAPTTKATAGRVAAAAATTGEREKGIRSYMIMTCTCDV